MDAVLLSYSFLEASLIALCDSKKTLLEEETEQKNLLCLVEIGLGVGIRDPRDPGTQFRVPSPKSRVGSLSVPSSAVLLAIVLSCDKFFTCSTVGHFHAS